jgi:hypothetical protein
LNKASVAWKPLRQFGNAYIGILTGMDAAFVVDSDVVAKERLEQGLLVPYAYRGAEVERFVDVLPAASVIFPYREGPDGSPVLIEESELKREYPRVHKHLSGFREELRKRMDSRRFYAKGADWYRHLRPGSFNYIRPRKLIVKGIDTRIRVGLLSEDAAFNGANCPGIILEDPQGHRTEYFLGLVNSTLLTYHLRMVCPPKLGGYTRFNATNISDLPIRRIDFTSAADKARHDRMVELVERMLSLHRQLPSAKTPHDRTRLERLIAATDDEIDRLVYDLYGLTAEEIKIVEGEGTQ